MVFSSQTFLQRSRDLWTIELSNQWDVLGPFPIHAREQQYLSPSFPLNLTEIIDFHASWPSSYADNGQVSWSHAESDVEGNLEVSFPNIRWKSLRDTEGWAALQHHAVLRSTFTIQPPSSVSPTIPPPRLLVQLIQGSYFTILPENVEERKVPKWYAGNIYNMERALPRVVELPLPPSLNIPTTYHIYVSGDYEIRLFGDPRVQNSEIPVQKITLNMSVEDVAHDVVHEETQDVVCDFVNGFAFGDAMGIGLRSTSGWWTVHRVQILSESNDGFELKLQKPTRLAPSQTRVIPLNISQSKPFTDDAISLELTLSSTNSQSTQIKLQILLPIKQLPQWSVSNSSLVTGTYFYASHVPTFFVAKSPKFENGRVPRPAVLALHGAGVDVITQTFWPDALPQKDHSWIVVPTGRTSWGLDWHGPSAQDAWASVDALVGILNNNSAWRPWKLEPNARVVVLGHSNGGQGAWYLASRYPDRVLAVLPAAAFIKSQAYIPLTLSRSAHYIDPSLRAILESSLTPDDNDLFLTNLVDTPVFAIHGGDDDNVPVWHSRELVSVLKQWNSNSSVTFKEDPGQLHFYPTVFDNEQTQAFLDQVLATFSPHPASKSFTLTVALPSDSGTLHGWRVDRLSVPGRLGRLNVELDEEKVRVVSSNVKAFSVDTSVFAVRPGSLWIDNSHLPLPDVTAQARGVISFISVDHKVWKVNSKPNTLQRSGRVQTILSSDHAPLVFVVPHSDNERELSVALRTVHDLHIYHRLDAEILRDTEVAPNIGFGNLVVIGNRAAATLRATFSQEEGFSMKPAPGSLEGPGLGLVFLHPHPTNKDGKMLLMQSTDDSGLERAARLFPIRTGVAVPDWVIVGPEADKIGAAGVVSAGVWDSDWDWNPVMSWVH
ncbi:hypothetical protein E1B28_008545 [Marasmius oreades]|uniref:Peptidase S9 prolyl oligopeptidase catalytic domain-containing protein n=1 Tax=Marasmius oreades TaxID=181124 RepID=A0A9P7UTD7_9AGAR|nr:uncharacterized protein E1B28_008545 [Marasmius oreades]KAG7092176.1 hypothetical protein E1B28_008545 [Marasmius oreades]